jgi:hypothetical protein
VTYPGEEGICRNYLLVSDFSMSKFKIVGITYVKLIFLGQRHHQAYHKGLSTPFWRKKASSS